MSPSIVSLILTVASMIAIACVVILAPPEQAATAIPILATVGGLSSIVQGVTKPIGKGGGASSSASRGFVQLDLAALGVVCFVVLFLLVSAVSACGHTYRGSKSVARIDPSPQSPASGLLVTIAVDGSEVCTAEGDRSTIDVHANVARRICAAFPECAWTDGGSL